MGPGGVWEGAWVATPRPRLCQQSSSSAGEAAPGVLLFPAQGSGHRQPDPGTTKPAVTGMGPRGSLGAGVTVHF